MPIYEYQCEACGTVTEQLRRIAEADEPCACEGCGSDKTRRQHSVFSAKGDASTELPMSCEAAKAMGGCCGGGGCRHH